MTLAQLEYVLAVNRHRHFARAAEACSITQPTLSMQIRKLEEELDLQLFDRSKQPVLPTEAGATFLAQAERIIQEQHQLQELVSQLKGSLQGSLKIGIIPTLAPYLLPYIGGPFVRAYPNIHLQVEELTTEQIVARLKKDELDAGLLVTPLHDKAIREEVLFFEEIYLYVHPEHQLHAEDELHFSDLQQPDLWLLAQGHCFRHQMLNLCARAGSSNKLPFRFESGSLETLRRLVETEGGYTFLPELATQELNEEQQANLKRLAAPRPLREISLVKTRSQAKGRMLKVFSDFILEQLPDNLQNDQRGTVVEWK